MPDVSAPTWDELRPAVTAVLAALPDGGFAVLGEPVPERPRAGGLRGRLGGRAAPVPTRFVQARRDGGTLTLECVGAASFGGPLALDADVDARLRALGWLAPGDPGYEPMGGPQYRVWIEVVDLARATELLLASLGVLGLEPTGPLELTTGLPA